MKISIIGAGMVGMTYAYRLLVSNLARTIVILDVNEKRCEAEVTELHHCLAVEGNTHVVHGTYADLAGSDLVVITAGIAQQPGQSRLDLMHTNTQIMRDIANYIHTYAPDTLVVVATNPLDVMTYVTLKESGFDPTRVIGSGTMLDTSRFKFHLAEYLGVNPRDIFAYILGEHGDSQVPIYSHISVKGIPVHEYCQNSTLCFDTHAQESVHKKTRDAATQIIEGKRATYYGIASALLRITRSLTRNEQGILPVSVLLQGEYDLHDVCLSIPVVLGSTGVIRRITLALNETEKRALHASAEVVKKHQEALGYL